METIQDPSRGVDHLHGLPRLQWVEQHSDKVYVLKDGKSLLVKEQPCT
jgi:hypothetical protein